MRVKSILPTLVTIFVLAAITTNTPALAQSHPQFIKLARMVKGALYLPDNGPAPRVGILLMHGYLEFPRPHRLHGIFQTRLRGALHDRPFGQQRSARYLE